jgi:uncharacterized RDD family membrane protein YckC
MVFLLLNGKLLLTQGQTIAKRLLNITIVDLQGSNATKSHLIKRYGLYFGLQTIPCMGSILHQQPLS